MEGPFFWGF